MECTVVVLGKNYLTPLGVIRSLAKAGYPVELIYVANRAGDSRIVAASRYLNRTIEIVGRNDHAIIDSLLENYGKTDETHVLFPTDDYTALLIDRYREKLSGRFLFPHIVGGSIAQKMDKSFQSALARQCGLNTAKEWTISLDMEEIAIPDGIPFPCFVKPLVSAVGGKGELERCDSRNALDRKLRKMQERLRKRSVLIQEFLNVEQEYTIGGVCDNEDIVLPAVIRKTCVAQHFRGVTLSGVMVDNSELGDAMPKIMRFLKFVNFVGMFDLEIMKTDRGLFFGELNLRCGGPSYAYYMSGINLPALAVESICGKPLEDSQVSVRLNKTFVNNKVAFEDYAYLFISKAELDRKLEKSDFTMMTDDDDPGPEKLFTDKMKPKYRKIRLKNRVKRVLGRY